MAERKISLAELFATKQKKDESAIDFIKRWRDLSMKCKEPPSQEEAVKICKKNLRYEITERIIGSDIRTFDRLNNAVAEIEMFLADRPNAVTSSSSGKPKFVDKKNNSPKEVNSVDLGAVLDGKTGGTTGGAQATLLPAIIKAKRRGGRHWRTRCKGLLPSPGIRPERYSSLPKRKVL